MSDENLKQHFIKIYTERVRVQDMRAALLGNASFLFLWNIMVTLRKSHDILFLFFSSVFFFLFFARYIVQCVSVITLRLNLFTFFMHLLECLLIDQAQFCKAKANMCELEETDRIQYIKLLLSNVCNDACVC